MDETLPSRRSLLLCAILVSVLCAAALLVTSPGLPMAWDEGNAILRAEGIPRGQWHYTTVIEGHPALYGILIAAGRWMSGWWLPPLQAARFGPIVLMAVAAGAMFYRIGREFSLAAAAGAVTGLMLMPRMFAHAHFASCDGPLTSCWILAWATLAPALRRWPVAVLWGIALGMTFSCKATGWIAVLPMVAWVGLYHRRVCKGDSPIFPAGKSGQSPRYSSAAAKALAIGLPVALATFFLLNPPLWADPIRGMGDFFHLNFNRAANPGMNISTWFLGRMYNLDHPLPWYNTLFWTAVAVPLGILLLAGVGLLKTVRGYRTEAAGMLIVFNWFVLLLVRALPGTPPHDGIRLFLPSFAFLAALAGIGCGEVLGWAAGQRSRWAARSAVALLYATGAAGLLVYCPQWLSYYNLSLGGLPGATALGMEPTYYWDALDGSVLDWLDENTAEDQRICFGGGSHENLQLMQRWGTLRRRWGTLHERLDPIPPGRYRWYVIQHRPSFCQAPDLWLIANARPSFRKTILGVPLVSVYEYGQYERACRQPR